MDSNDFDNSDISALKAVLQSLNRITFKELEGSEVIAISSAYSQLHKLQSKIITYLRDKEVEKIPEKKVQKKSKLKRKRNV